MGNGFQFLDIILFAVIAAFLVLRLRGVLGRRAGHQPRPRDRADNKRRQQEGETEGNVVELPDLSRRGDEEEQEAADVDDDPVAAALTQIRIADNSFDPDQFVAGARAAFEMVVHAFATGDTGALRSLLSDDVFEHFQGAIEARLEQGETLETTVIGIKSAEIIDAEFGGRNAILTVKFVSEQVNVTRDTEGGVVDGDPNQVADVTDIWMFARNMRSRDPNWKLVETRSPN